jgi:hypothetical protein
MSDYEQNKSHRGIKFLRVYNRRGSWKCIWEKFDFHLFCVTRLLASVSKNDFSDVSDDRLLFPCTKEISMWRRSDGSDFGCCSGYGKSAQRTAKINSWQIPNRDRDIGRNLVVSEGKLLYRGQILTWWWQLQNSFLVYCCVHQMHVAPRKQI